MAVALAPQRGVLRTLRGSALATVNAALAAAAHAAGGGGTPDGALTVLLAVGVAAAGTALADRRRGPVAILAAVAVTQLVLHLLLDALGRQHGVPQMVLKGTSMAVAHAVAVVITAALLAGAESALFTIAAALRRVLDAFPLLQALLRASVPAGPAPLAPPAPPLVSLPPPTALRTLLGRVTPHRGPPGG